MYNDYLSKRKSINVNWEQMDQWPLYVGIHNLARSIHNQDLIRESVDVPGHIVEFGSWRGSNVLLMAKTLSIFSPFTQKKVISFDLFSNGLDFFDKKDKKSIQFKGEYDGDYQHLNELIDLFQLNESIELVKGNILETLPSFIEDNNPFFSMIYVDTDLYKTTDLILKSLHDRLSIGGKFVFDEWNFKEFPGESQGVKEFLEQKGDCYDMISVKNSRQPSLILKKIKN